MESFESSGDLRCLLGPQASAEAEALRGEIGWSRFEPLPATAVIHRELDAIVLAGRFSWARCQELPGPDRLDALLEATELFAVTFPLAPGLVPMQAAGVCAAISRPDGVNPVELHNDALDMLDEALARQDLKAVDQAIWHIAAAVLAAHDDPAEPFFLTSLGSAWLDRFEITGRARDIDNSVTALRRAVSASGPGWEEAGRRANLSSALVKRFELLGSMPDLDEAVTTGQAAAELARKAKSDVEIGMIEPDRADAVGLALNASLTSLSAALLASFEYRRNRLDLDAAVRVSYEAVELSTGDDPGRAGRLANLANMLGERFSLFHHVADLEEAFQAAQEAIAGLRPGDRTRALCLSALGLLHANRFDFTGERDALDQAVLVGRQAVTAAPDAHPGQAACLSNLGAALHRRYDHYGDSEALVEAVDMHRRAVQATPAGPRRARYLNNLGNALRSRFAATADGITRNPRAADIHESIAGLNEAVAIAGADDTGRAGYVADLALSLVMAAERGIDPPALDQAITTLEREVHAISNDHPLRHIYFASLGNAWRVRSDAAADQNALGNSISWFRLATDALPDGHLRHAENLASLGAVLLRRFGYTADHADGWEALTVSKRAASSAAAPPLTRALAARNWGEAAAGMGMAHEAVNGFAASVDLLEMVAWRGLRRRDQERQLGRFVALACDAAAWAITVGQPELAVGLLEQGRGVLLARSLNERARYYDLARADQGLAEGLTRADQALANLALADNPLAPDTETLGRRQAELFRERETLLRQIRRLPGLEDFLRPPEFASLRDAAADGPVVIINVSQYRCDALIVTTSDVKVTRLGSLSSATVVDKAAAFISALHELTRAETEEEAETSQEVIAATLSWLWDDIASPLMPDLHAAALSYNQANGRRPHIWWCPTGPLTFLPLHAAGRHDIAGEAVIDRFTSSYAPTLRLLRQARHQADSDSVNPSPLLVALPDAPGHPYLPGVGQEADSFAERFSQALQLRGPDATVQATRNALNGCPSWVHFACHGIQDISDPSAGHLALYDGPLPIGEIGRLHLAATELAFLSACETSRGGAALADEAITLATAFRLAGYRHVVGTLWSISDKLAPAVADQVYKALALPGGTGIDVGNTAEALSAAVLTLRQRHADQPWFWAPYIHIGP